MQASREIRRGSASVARWPKVEAWLARNRRSCNIDAEREQSGCSREKRLGRRWVRWAGYADEELDASATSTRSCEETSRGTVWACEGGANGRGLTWRRRAGQLGLRRSSIFRRPQVIGHAGQTLCSSLLTDTQQIPDRDCLSARSIGGIHCSATASSASMDRARCKAPALLMPVFVLEPAPVLGSVLTAWVHVLWPGIRPCSWHGLCPLCATLPAS